jgi:hypothetical protein
MFWNRKNHKKSTWKDDLENLRNGINYSIGKLKSDMVTDPDNSVYYVHMLNACYEALSHISEGSISGVSMTETTLSFGRAGNFDHLESNYHFAHNMSERYYSNYYSDYRYS